MRKTALEVVFLPNWLYETSGFFELKKVFFTPSAKGCEIMLPLEKCEYHHYIRIHAAV